MNSKNKMKKDNNNVRAMQKTCLSIKHKVSNYKRKKNTIKKVPLTNMHKNCSAFKH